MSDITDPNASDPGRLRTELDAALQRAETWRANFEDAHLRTQKVIAELEAAKREADEHVRGYERAMVTIHELQGDLIAIRQERDEALRKLDAGKCACKSHAILVHTQMRAEGMERARDEAHAKYLGAIQANEEWHQEVIKLRGAISRVRAALEGMPAVEAMAKLIFPGSWEHYPWQAEPFAKDRCLKRAEDILTALRERCFGDAESKEES